MSATQISMFDGNQEFKIDKPIRLIELFAGYGSQHLALKYLGVPVESYRICEWAYKSIQAYKDLHFSGDNTDYSSGMTDDEIYDYLADKGISANYNVPMTRTQIQRRGIQKARTDYNNIRATHNLVNIMQAHAADLNIVDTDKYCYIMTYSFPCQDLSKAGRGKGMAKDSGTRSGLLWEVERILDECNGNLTQVLLMENVPDVIGTKNTKHFSKWLEKLESIGYRCYWKILNGKDYGIPQNRERCFMVSILGDYFYEFPDTIPLEKRLKDIIETDVDEKYYLKALIMAQSSHDGDIAGPQGCDKTRNLPRLINIANCITTREDRGISNHKAEGTAIIERNNRNRKLTPRECWRLMGVKDEDYERAAVNQSDSSLYHLAGDSIITNVLMAIFKNLICP